MFLLSTDFVRQNHETKWSVVQNLFAINLFIHLVSALAQDSGELYSDVTESSEPVDDGFVPNVVSFLPEANIPENSNDVKDEEKLIDPPVQGLRYLNQVCATLLTFFKLQTTWTETTKKISIRQV